MSSLLPLASSSTPSPGSKYPPDVESSSYNGSSNSIPFEPTIPRTVTTSTDINRTSCPNDEMTCWLDLKFRELDSNFSQNIISFSEQFEGLPEKCRSGSFEHVIHKSLRNIFVLTET
ncbi:hypothetical protein HELRODRAFT_178028 [Helobdella robusta]|uniref:Uncharacterized protein n=1 Tax=Helobdella robusta TaxID=6412 RepID=T1FCM7_HELRO|nr:hypothetical protein HELRODRAFT_178028 [Helobdella robusta]ESN97591.1 hypothetical protein HELRODRAFT_178028 [Helobdella robusta]